MTERSESRVAAVNAKNARRLLPILMLGYVLNTLDKSNVGFASLEMNRDLGFTPAMFGLGAALFFITYTAFEIPSNLLLRRFGARAWLSRILVSWGIVSMLMAVTWDVKSFYALRLLLGLAEAGWYPGVLFFLTLWFTRAFRARAITLFVLGVPVSAILGGPISGALLSMEPMLGLRNWQWLFIVEGLPTLILGFIAWRVLRDDPAEAEWLDAEEKRVLADALAQERAGREGGDEGQGFAAMLALFCLINFANALGLYSTSLWLPQAVKELGDLTNLQTGFATAIPFIFSAATLVVAAWSSDRLGERKWHVVGLFLLGAFGMAMTAASDGALAGLLWLTVAIMGGFGVQGTLYAMLSETLGRLGRSGTALAAALATITTVGNLGGFFGPYAVGLMRSATGDFRAPLLAIGAVFAIAALLTVAVRTGAPRAAAKPVAA